MKLTLRLLAGELSIVRLAADAEVPSWFRLAAAPISSITRTAHELSIVCASADVPGGLRCETAFRAFAVEGALDFSATGILSSLLNPLADAGISIFSISTFDTDYILVRNASLQAAMSALREKFAVMGD